MRALLGLAAFSAGCASCPTFEETVVVDEDGVLSAEELSAFEQAVDEVASWVRLEGACVAEVEISEDLVPGFSRDGFSHEWSGLYRGDGQIRVKPDASPTTVRHELCHAVDDVLGWPSSAEEEVFRPHADALQKDDYSDLGQLHESFAEACAEGPRDQALYAEVDRVCGEPVLYESFTLMAEEVFHPGLGDTGWTWVHRPTEVEAVDLSGLLEGTFPLDVAADGRHVVVLVARPHTAPSWLWPTPYRLLYIDPFEVSIVASHDIHGGTYWTMEGGDAGVVLLQDLYGGQLRRGTLEGIELVGKAGFQGHGDSLGLVGADEILLSGVLIDDDYQVMRGSPDGTSWEVVDLQGEAAMVRAIFPVGDGFVVQRDHPPDGSYRFDRVSWYPDEGAEPVILDGNGGFDRLLGLHEGLPVIADWSAGQAILRVDPEEEVAELIRPNCEQAELAEVSRTVEQVLALPGPDLWLYGRPYGEDHEITLARIRFVDD